MPNADPRSPTPDPGLLSGGVVALGNFDGVHRGHQAVVAAAVRYGQQHIMPARVLTLEPHPYSLFAKTKEPFRLTTASAKIRLLRELGIDEVITLTFSPDLAGLLPQAFVDEILVGRYQVKHVVAGANFAFGLNRAGTMATLREALARHHVEVTEVPSLMDESGETISSSRVRAALKQGDLDLAKKMLGRPWAITGVVVEGSQRGRELGFPTANMELGDLLRPPFGVYAVMARRVGETLFYDGVANIGTRPSVETGGEERLEFHLFNLPSGHIYGQEWEVELHAFLRPERRFADLEALREQIARDVDQALRDGAGE